MKQKRDGRKVQNWHRPLQKDELRAGFVRNRKFPELPCDEKWDYYDPWNYGSEPWNYGENGDAADLARFELDQTLSRLIAPPRQWLDDRLVKHTKDTPHASSELFAFVQPSSDSLIECLSQRFRGLTGNVAEVYVAADKILRSLNRPATLRAVTRIQAEYPNSSLIKSLCLFAPFWIRDLADWKVGDERSLVNHLLVRYEVPSFLNHEWIRAELRPKWICWFILLAQGADLKEASAQFGWKIHRRFVKFLFEAPDSLSPIEACLFAEVRRLGGTNADIQRLISNPAFVIDPTEMSAEPLHARFWQDSVQWLIANREQLTDEDCELVLSWAMHEFTEAAQVRQPFSLKGRSVRAALERSVAYRELVSRPWAHLSWAAHSWNWSVETTAGVWEFVELTTGEQLFEEGRNLNHCVATYAARCASGYSSIVSLRQDGGRRITIEIQPHSKKLVQARGKYNCSPEAQEWSIIQQWLSTAVHT